MAVTFRAPSVPHDFIVRLHEAADAALDGDWHLSVLKSRLDGQWHFQLERADRRYRTAISSLETVTVDELTTMLRRLPDPSVLSADERA